MQVRISFIQYSCRGIFTEYKLGTNTLPDREAVNKAVKDSDLVEAKF